MEDSKKDNLIPFRQRKEALPPSKTDTKLMEMEVPILSVKEFIAIVFKETPNGPEFNQSKLDSIASTVVTQALTYSIGNKVQIGEGLIIMGFPGCCFTMGKGVTIGCHVYVDPSKMKRGQTAEEIYLILRHYINEKLRDPLLNLMK